MALKECFDKGMLKKIMSDPDRKSAELKLAKHYLQRAEGNIEIEFYDVVLLMSYTAMLHAARALLYRDGVKERSHGCVVAYLREKYKQLSKESEILDHYRLNRHLVQYEGGDVSEEDALESIKDAKRLLDTISGLLK